MGTIIVERTKKARGICFTKLLSLLSLAFLFFSTITVTMFHIVPTAESTDYPKWEHLKRHTLNQNEFCKSY